MELLALAVSRSSEVSFLSSADVFKVPPLTSLRAFKKAARQQKPALILLSVSNPDDEALCSDVAEYTRRGLVNRDTRLVLLRDPNFHLDETLWMEKYQINACLMGAEAQQAFNRTVINRELDTFSYIENNHRQHDAETDMLMCITRFSRADEGTAELVKVFSKSLAGLCRAAATFHLKPTKSEGWAVSFAECEQREVVSAMHALVESKPLPSCLKHAVEEAQPQIGLLNEGAGIDSVTRKIPEQVGSYLIFPIVVYEQVVCLMLYLIPESQMDCVSMKQINIINKASEQLTILLERKKAELSLKKQYRRLKSTMLELKSTREELAHNEKMATIGRMAAGIAHEINNPLAFVISNISSMDNYLESIMQLQEMQNELLTSIDVQQDQKAVALRHSISQFEEQEDMPFILEDIRAVVADSYEGLQRVKNIITDLRSFTYHQQTERTSCNVQTVINETLKIFKYDIEGKVDIQQSVSISNEFESHPGLLGQVLTNLVKNAIQAMAEAEVSAPLIHIDAKETPNGLRIAVKDNGPGICEEVKKKIFDPFFTTKPVGEGTGLGLSVTENMVKKLGGELVCNSVLGEYTEFAMVLPFVECDG